MATAAALLFQLRRSRQSSSLHLLSLPRVLSSHQSSPPPPPPPPLLPPPHSPKKPATPLALLSSRAFSTHSSHNPDSDTDSPVNSELLNAIVDSTVGGEDNLISPVCALISILDAYHDFSGFPWWITIVSSTLALRMVLLCPQILTLHKVKRIAEFLPKLPPPFPPPFSGKSYILQFVFFRKKRKEVGCPSYLWPLVPLIIQAPCFFLWMFSINKMSHAGHPGFNCGGVLWFQNLTETSHGYSGFIFPFLIAGLHNTNVLISFRTPLVKEETDIFRSLAKLFKQYLHFLTLPIAFMSFCLPQGSQLYWVTNSSFTLIQHIALRHPTVLAKLGLPDKSSQKAVSEETDASKTTRLNSLGLQDNSPTAATKENVSPGKIPLASPEKWHKITRMTLGLQDNSTTAATEETVSPEKNPLDSPEKWHKIPVENLSPKELITLSVPFLSSEDKESAIPLLKLALEKDPEYVRALVLMGRVLLLKHMNAEANEYFERAISQLTHNGYPTDAEYIDLLILASQWAGVAYERQGKKAEARAHFERIANMEEPDDPESKSYYFDGLLLLASALYDAGQKEEAAKYLRPVVAFNPAYRKLLEQCERDIDIVSHHTSSRREL